MEYTIKELSDILSLRFSGDGTVVINHVCGIERIKAGGLAYINNPIELENLPTPKGIFDKRRKKLDSDTFSDRSAVIVPLNTTDSSHNQIFSDDPIRDHIRATDLIHEKPFFSHQVHPNAILGKEVRLGDNISIDPGVVIYDGVTIGSHSTIRSGSVIMENCSIGENCLIYPNVTIREKCQIGDRVIIHSGAVIGSDGYGYYQRDKLNKKIPQIGIVILEDDVEIGACTTVDRARFDKTVIRRGCKLDNLIHIAHNVDLGEDSLITAQSGIAGSVKTGHHLMMGGQSGIKDNLKIGNNVTMLARTLISSKTDDHSTVAGMPSRPIHVWRQIQALINNLESLFNRVKAIEKERNR